MAFFDKILRMGEGRTLRRFERLADEVLKLEDEYTQLSDEQLKAKTDEFRQALDNGKTEDDILVEAFATVREAAWRVLKQKPFRVQVVGGIALHQGNIAEMKTGEGKTLVATMPSYLNALSGKGVHVVTVNDYLASYQSELMGRVHKFLGLTVGCLVNDLEGGQPRRDAYNCDITYGTNNEFGFDYLRDNMAQDKNNKVQREHHYAIVDEVDSILIDEARTPLIISGPAMGEADKWYSTFADIVKHLERDKDYEVDEKKHTVGILETGIDKVEDILAIDNLYEASHTPLIGFLNNAIKAKELFQRDRDYIVHRGEVIIVDEHTGRTMEGRRYSEGIHQSIEAKERVEIKAENQTYATITLQNYFRLYDKLAGMTGTAETEAAEFMSTYKIGVIPIPTNRPMIRQDCSDLVYPSRRGKLKAIVSDIEERYKKGQPVLVGTTDVAKSEELSALLKSVNVPHEVLNAKQHEREAQVVFEAGRKGAVTVATNMAGRGTDIMLGGNPEHIADQNLRKRGLDPDADPQQWREQWSQALEEAEEAVAAEHEEVKKLGGLYVLGTERHDSRRIDNQLRGRSGRQGDPGESRFYLSMEDPLMVKFASGMAQRIMSSGAYPEDMPLESKMVSKAIQSAQRQVEGQHFEMRKNVLKYDDVMTDQRNLIYDQRSRVMDGDIDFESMLDHYMNMVIDEYVDTALAAERPEDWDIDALWSQLRGIYPVSIDAEELVESVGGLMSVTKDDIREALKDDIVTQFNKAASDIDANPMAQEQLDTQQPTRRLVQIILLESVDKLWREHLYEMDYLREGIGLRAMGQRDPLIEYKSEGAHMFQAMMAKVREQTVTSLFSYAHRYKEAYETYRENEEKEAQAQQEREKKTSMADAEKQAGLSVIDATLRRQQSSDLGQLTMTGPGEDSTPRTQRRGKKTTKESRYAQTGAQKRAAKKEAARRKKEARKKNR
ncbi:MAG: preprotein translocase subunit SecA [Actinomycetaceae bacterium]|nr:preprotein translocase subunit SecA [Actinomycetaceae bacterium]